MKQTRITSKPDGDSPLVEVEAVAVRHEAYFGEDRESKTAYDDVTITIKSANVSSTHRIYGASGDFGGWKDVPSIAQFLPLPLQEDERFGQVIRDLMKQMVNIHVVQVKQMGEILPDQLEKGHLALNSFHSVSE